MADFDQWIGRQHEQSDRIDPARTNALLAALGKDRKLAAGDPLPLLHHWLYFWHVEPPAKLGADGHPAKGGFLPPIDLPRRMWAGGRVTFYEPILVDAVVSKVTTIRSIVEKSGRSGRLVFVTLGHEFKADGRTALIEEQDLVYREAVQQTAAKNEPEPALSIETSRWTEIAMPDPTLLFRYSALTMNGHRIHYDRDYATGIEHYPGLVVHGPLQATLMIELAASHLKGRISRFTYRGVSPAFAGHRLHIHCLPTADGADMWVRQGAVQTMIGAATAVDSDLGDPVA
jgi:3-methylfumaryl-CoA hydratase